MTVADLIRDRADRHAEYGLPRDDMWRYLDAVKAVADLHQPDPDRPVCTACGETEACASTDWPCPTIRAIADALGVKED